MIRKSQRIINLLKLYNAGRMDTFLESFQDFMTGGDADEDSDYAVQPYMNTMISQLRDDLLAFKKALFRAMVQNDTSKSHSPGTMNSMYAYNSLFLQSIAYWIGRLDGNNVPVPKINDIPSRELFNTINHRIVNEVLQSSEAKILAYNELFIMSTSHPYNFHHRDNNNL